MRSDVNCATVDSGHAAGSLAVWKVRGLGVEAGGEDLSPHLETEGRVVVQTLCRVWDSPRELILGECSSPPSLMF